MNFADKMANNKNGVLSFLKDVGFYEDKKTGYNNEYYSCNGLYYNRVTVFIDGDSVKAVNYQEFNVGGDTGLYEAKMEVENITNDKVLALINEVLPNDLD